MGFYSLELDELSNYTGTPVEKLKTKSYVKLESMIQNMKKAKFIEQNNKNAQDKEYERLIHKFFKPMKFLCHWFNEKEIVLACANTGVTIRDICSEQFVTPGTGKAFWEKHGEYLRTSVEFITQYDKQGRELMERKREKVDVYRVQNRYHGLCHGKVIEYLLYERYPELQKFGFKFYECRPYDSEYEIYPDNGIYVPFTALMSGDIDSIIYRNRDYCKMYNNGRYSPEECEKAFHAKEALEMFDMIRHVGESEREMGHFPVSTDKDGKLIMANGMKETKVSTSGNVKFLQYDKDRTNNKTFKLYMTIPYTVRCLLSEFLSMTGKLPVDIQISSITELGTHGIHIRDLKEDLVAPDAKDAFLNCRVHNAFGWIQKGEYHLIVRINIRE